MDLKIGTNMENKGLSRRGIYIKRQEKKKKKTQRDKMKERNRWQCM
jgi:hypothetical protein